MQIEKGELSRDKPWSAIKREICCNLDDISEVKIPLFQRRTGKLIKKIMFFLEGIWAFFHWISNPFHVHEFKSITQYNSIFLSLQQNKKQNYPVPSIFIFASQEWRYAPLLLARAKRRGAYRHPWLKRRGAYRHLWLAKMLPSLFRRQWKIVYINVIFKTKLPHFSTSVLWYI